jgi:hypothetical protein
MKAAHNVIPFPARPGTPEHWIGRNPQVFFVCSEGRPRRCSLCNKRIAPGEEYFGMYAFKWSAIYALIESGGEAVTDTFVTEKVAMRVHPACARKPT